MDNAYYLQQFESKLKKYYGTTRIQRLKKAPMRLIYSKALEVYAVLFRKAIRVKARTFWGDETTVVFPEVVSLTIYRYGFFEEGLTRALLEYLKPGMTFFDIGAHFGYFTLLGSEIVGNNGQVHSFEPTPSTFEVLQSNIRNKGNVYANNVAVFSKRATVVFNDYGVKYSALNSLYDARFSKNLLKKLNPQKYNIQAISLDEYIYGKNVIPDLIKIDAESAEWEILKGMEQTLREIRPIISLEVGDMDINGVVSSKDCIKYLTNLGYQPYEFEDRRIVKHWLRNKYVCGNIFFLP